MTGRMRAWIGALGVSLALVACSAGEEVVVFHAASLSRTLSELATRFSEKNPRVRVRLEASGSQVAARKVSELGRKADLVAVADTTLIDTMLMPTHATWAADLVTNEIVIAHRDHSRYTDIIQTDNWPHILARHDVVLGCVDPNMAPIGYRTRLVWALTESAGMPGLAAKLASHCSPEHVMTDESALVALLFARSIDYAFVYRSTAEEQHLKVTTLPEAYNLGATDVDYSRATVSVQMNHSEPARVITGAPIIYGMTIPVRRSNRHFASAR